MAKSKRRFFLSAVQAKILEISGYVVVAALFVVLALVNRTAFCAAEKVVPEEEEPAAVSGLQAFDLYAAISRANMQAGDTTLVLSDGTAWPYTLASDPKGVTSFSVTVPLYATAEGTSETARIANAQNEAVTNALSPLVDALCGAIGHDAVGADKILKACVSAADSGTDKSVSLKPFSIRVHPDKNGVTLTFLRSDTL